MVARASSSGKQPRKWPSLLSNEPPALVKRDGPKRGAQVLPPGKMKVTASVELDIGDIGTEIGQAMLDDAIGG